MSGLGPTSKRSLFPTAEVRVATSIRIRSSATIQQGGGCKHNNYFFNYGKS